MTTNTPNPSGVDKRDAGQARPSGAVFSPPTPARSSNDESARNVTPTHRSDEATRSLQASPQAAVAGQGEQPFSAQALKCLDSIEKNVSELRRELSARASGSKSVQEPTSGGPQARTGTIPGMTL